MTSQKPSNVTVIRATTKEQIEQCYNIRYEVFSDEQGYSRELEVDELDDHAAQFLAIENGTPVGTIRLVHPPASATFKLGRLAVRKQGRGKGTAQKLIAALEERAKELGGTEVYSGAQVPVRLLYEKAGYHVVDEEGYLDEGQPHVMMMKSLT